MDGETWGLGHSSKSLKFTVVVDYLKAEVYLMGTTAIDNTSWPGLPLLVCDFVWTDTGGLLATSLLKSPAPLGP
jgi:hypothetical protein